jgi:TonB family protein
MRALLWSAVVCGCLVGEVGLISEAVAQPVMTAPVRVGGNIRPPTKIRDVRPVYPAEALGARVAGIVILEITIDAGGSVTDARVLRGVPMLNDAALDAVKQWQYTPTLLNGTPVPVIMTVTVNFSLGGPSGQSEGQWNDGRVGQLSGSPYGPSGPPAADPSGAAAANKSPYLITPGRVGVVWIGMPASALAQAIPATQTRSVPRRTPRGISSDIEIALEPGGPTALVANVVDGHVMQVEVRNDRFRTAQGFGVGTTLGELRRIDRYLSVVMCDRGPCAVTSGRLYTFELDAPGATGPELAQLPDSTPVTGVLIARPVMLPPPPPPPPAPPRE